MNVPTLLSLALLAATLSIPAAAQDRPVGRSASSVPRLPPAATAGAPRILLVDDDFSDNNHNPGDSRLSPSDRVFRKLVADAVGGDAKAWAIEAVKPYASGPGIERLRPFSVIVWYTGAIYGGNPDNTGVLSLEDEKTVRQYLEQVGGAVIVFSPGYLSKVLGASGTWEKADWPFVSQVLGIRGGVGLAQRFEAGTVSASGGGRFSVGKGGGVEPQFSFINPAGASVLFTTVPSPARNFPHATPVATVHPYGRGRIVYVGFTFENLAQADLPPAFRTLLAAAGSPASPAPSVSSPQAPVQRQATGSSLGPLTVQVSGTPLKTTLKWALPTATVANASLPGPGQAARKAPTSTAPKPTVVVERREPSRYTSGAFVWEKIIVHPDLWELVDPGAIPGTTQNYRVTVTDPSGATASKEVEYKVPPLQDPASLTATVQGDGSIILTWPEVPGVTKYRVHATSPSHGSVEAVVVDGATEWRSPPLNGVMRDWWVTALYFWDGEYRSMTPRENWTWARTESSSAYYLTAGTYTIHTGNDNKELLSDFEVSLYINGGETQPEDSANPNPHRLQYVSKVFGGTAELKVNSSADVRLTTSVDTHWTPNKNNLASIQRHGLRIRIKYLPNFFLDAWKIDRVTVKLQFQNDQQMDEHRRTSQRRFSPGMEKTITFPVARLLTASDNQIEFIADGAFQPAP